MENQIIEFEKRQVEITNRSRTLYSRLEGAYKESEKLINMIAYKQKELADIRKKLWITILIMSIIVVGMFLLKTQL